MNKLNMRCELLDVEGSFNVRDLGGYQAANGKLIKPRRFLRSGSLHGLTPQGRKTLLEAGIRCVIDLRSSQEVKSNPDTLQNDSAFAWYHVPLLDYIQSSLADSNPKHFPDSMEEMYTGLLDESGAAFCRLFELFADTRYPGAIFHCTAGKDRTGMSAMLLLALAGVNEETIVEDYSHSERLLEPLNGEHPTDFPRYVLLSKPETMWTTLRHLSDRYGGARGYLRRIGVTQEQCARVLAKLLD